MTTNATPGTADAPTPLAETCDVCNERRAIWMSVEHGRDFVVCTPCREGEPCDRCGIERDRCGCPEGPDVLKWLPITVNG